MPDFTIKNITQETQPIIPVAKHTTTSAIKTQNTANPGKTTPEQKDDKAKIIKVPTPEPTPKAKIIGHITTGQQWSDNKNPK